MVDDEPAGPGEARVRAIARRMAVDHWTVRTIEALRGAGVDPVLLKGPAVADWLWPGNRSARTYDDADLLVSPTDLVATRATLVGLAFERVSPPVEELDGRRRRHAETWVRWRDHAAVDLHQVLHGLEHLEPATVWTVVQREPDQLRVAGATVAVPSATVRTLHVVLHLQPKDEPGTKAWRDLERALEVVPDETWRRAADLARELEVADAVGALLSLVPGGAERAAAVGLPTAPPAWLVRHHRRHASALERAALRLGTARPADLPRLVLRLVAPPRTAMVVTFPVARRGRLGLAAAHLQRWTRLPGHLARTVRARRTRGRHLR